MKRSEREQQLKKARLACGALLFYIVGKDGSVVLGPADRENVSALVKEFRRLAGAEAKEVKAGARGGRPRHEDPSPEALRKRAARAKTKEGSR